MSSEEITCSAGHYICFISPEGDVTPCVQLPIRCGNVRTNGFGWIWRHSPEMLKIRQLRMKDIRGCNDCPHLPWCARCPGLAYLEDGDLLGPSSAACWMAEAREKDMSIKLAL
jgi:radical SAM protein with 4Fe4S-binding SPASM domain